MALLVAAAVTGALSARAVAVIGLIVLAAGVSALGTSVDRVKTEANAFQHLQGQTKPGTRLITGGGTRYDYWRIAAIEFKHAPLMGVGAGNYERDYFRERRTAENIRQPHSIEFQALSELGVMGGIALVLFVGGVLWGFRRRVAAATASGSDRILAVAAGGMFLTWLVHTSVDWLHLIPGVTGVALCAAAVLVGPWAQPSGAPHAKRRRRLVLGACAVAVVFGAVVVGRSAVARAQRRVLARLLPQSRGVGAARPLCRGAGHPPRCRAAGAARLRDVDVAGRSRHAPRRPRPGTP